jgi:nitrogen PTS system EIIA component
LILRAGAPPELKRNGHVLIKTAEIARLLAIPEKKVISWIKKDGLRASMIDDQYRINRVDLLEWATEHGIKVPPELFSSHPNEMQFPLLSKALEAGGVHCGVPGTDKITVLTNVVHLLPLPPQIDPEFVLQVLMAREALGTTAVGDGIAIPHVRNPILLNIALPAITLCFLDEPIDFNAVDGNPVHILFTLTSPTVQSHLHLLSKLAYVLRDERFKEILRRQCDPPGILDMVKTIEAGLGR